MADTPYIPGNETRGTVGVALTAKGVMVAVDTGNSNKMCPAADTATHIVVGVNVKAGAVGDTNYVARGGIYRFTNSTSSALTAASVYKVCYVENSTTVASASSNSIIAGTVVGVDSNGVWVDVAKDYHTHS